MRPYIKYILSIIFLAYSFGESKNLPDMKLKDLENKRVMINDFYSETPILINFWTLACEPCKKEMKFLDKFNDKYSDNGFRVISVNMDNPRSMSKVKSYIKSQKYSFKVLSDPKSELFRKTGGKVMPYILMVNMDGSIFQRHIGFTIGDEKELEKDIIHLIENNKSVDDEKN
ncbi:MAG: TlpA family protein disulfide reductase [Candidatus Marinimicrobia bacterium]|jgi:thiol-disulfide isomerase/thioredoxin|nr:TlpA family protein disulfide reductase [Candidatus Neomarinimicrobiota bacterium]MBT3682687.1 TlpA family protein disulfide reductase [Candidatus Neomarinimicrobiota bacterium]MBT3759658.1 TlpA family protein disulfide reductase [Candidatus Neomarinimicrobiota bacterium]MBT3894470.1 TlpA family protein disulfide reductase [Candidatus Neomarinimicrobiota bacterium]MBT4172513.1 TlpA family protein disulfide reductase [Candidatus Neomarinimicrobiota bacterium]